jgi:hypothetical protein
LWTCCGFVVQLVVGPTAQTPLVRFVVDLLWICCGFTVQLVVQQIEQVEFKLNYLNKGNAKRAPHEAVYDGVQTHIDHHQQLHVDQEAGRRRAISVAYYIHVDLQW